MGCFWEEQNDDPMKDEIAISSRLGMTVGGAEILNVFASVT